MPSSLVLYEFSDRELLWILFDQADAEGIIRVGDVARALNLTHRRPNQCVGSRLARLRQLGVVDKHTHGKWRLTERGERLMRGNMRAAAARAMDEMSDEGLYALTSIVTQRMRMMDEGTSRMLDREYRHGTYRPPSPMRRKVTEVAL